MTLVAAAKSGALQFAGHTRVAEAKRSAFQWARLVVAAKSRALQWARQTPAARVALVHSLAHQLACCSSRVCTENQRKEERAPSSPPSRQYSVNIASTLSAGTLFNESGSEEAIEQASEREWGIS